MGTTDRISTVTPPSPPALAVPPEPVEREITAERIPSRVEKGEPGRTVYDRVLLSGEVYLPEVIRTAGAAPETEIDPQMPRAASLSGLAGKEA